VNAQWQRPVVTEITPRALTDDEIRVDIAAKLEAMHAAWQASSGIERDRQLLGALTLCGPFRPLPDWLYQELRDQIKSRLQEHDNWLLTGEHVPPKGLQKPDPDWLRWFVMTEVRREGLKGKNAEVEASKRLTGTLAKGKPRTMKRAYQLIRRNMRQGQRRQNRTNLPS